MRRWLAAAAAFTCVFSTISFSIPALTEPAFDLEEPGDVGEAAQASAASAGGKKLILPAKPAARAAKGISSLDEDGDGLADGLKALIDEQGANALVDVIVTFEAPGKGAAWAQGQVGNFTVTSEFDVIPAFAATMRGGQAQALSRANGVFRVEANDVMSITLKAVRDNFGADRLPYHVEFDAAVADYLGPNTGVAFPNEGGGAGVNVCIIDTGIHGTHEMFDTERSDGISTPRILEFVDFIASPTGDESGPPTDNHGHGTHVAGIVGGDGWTLVDTGVAAEFRGVAPQVNFLVAKVLDANGNGTVETVLAGIQWCQEKLAEWLAPGVINMSLGEAGSSDGQDAVSLAVNAVVAGDAVGEPPLLPYPPIPVVVAAGNEGAVPYSTGSPAAAADAITVGAFKEWAADNSYIGYSQGGSIAQFSSRGPNALGVIKPDMVAPGYTIWAPYRDVPGVCVNDCYTGMSGTSMAAPHVTGTVALMLEQDSSLTPTDIKSILTGTARPWSTGPLPNNENGWGLLDSYAAVQAVDVDLVDDSPTPMPYLYEGNARVRKNGFKDIPITLDDPMLPLAITVIIDGQTNVFGEWDPDLDVQLLDEFGNPIEIAPGFPLFGTWSTCKAGYECGVAGRQETVHIGPDLTVPPGTDWYPANWILRVNTYTGWPNNGKAGTFSYQISNGYKTGDGPAPDPDPDPGTLTADAGPDQTKSDKKNDGTETVTLDGSGSTGSITSYLWSITDNSDGSPVPVVPGNTAVIQVDLVLGSYTATLTVGDGTAIDSDVALVTIEPKSTGGGGGGGPPGRNSQSQQAQSQ